MGPPGPDGPRGPEGPAGPAGAPGATFILQHSWVDQTLVACCLFRPLVNVRLPFTSTGGPLMIFMNVVMTGGGHSSCQPMIDGTWAGQSGGFPSPPGSAVAPSWREGLIQTSGGGSRLWTPTRVYPNVPAGDHTFELQCATDMGTMSVNNNGSVVSSLSILELR